MASPIINVINNKIAVQDVVYWGSPTPDGYGGSRFAAPVAGKARFSNKNQLVMNAKGEQVVSNTELLLGKLEASVEPGGYFYLGPISSLTQGLASPPPEAQRVLTVSEIPMFGSTTDFVRRVYL